MAPAKLPLAALRLRVLAPRLTAPLPVRLAMAAPPLPTWSIRKVPLSVTPLEAAMLPLPVRNNAAPLSMLVAPV